MKTTATGDLLGIRYFSFNGTRLTSPLQHTVWETVHQRADNWSTSKAVRGEAGLHAAHVPDHSQWWTGAIDTEPTLITALVAVPGDGRPCDVVVGETGFRAERMTVLSLRVQCRAWVEPLRAHYRVPVVLCECEAEPSGDWIHEFTHDGQRVCTAVPGRLIELLKTAGFQHRGFFMNNGRDSGETHDFKHPTLRIKLNCKGAYGRHPWTWCYGLDGKDGKYSWCWCDFLSWEHCLKVLCTVLRGERTPGLTGLDDPLRSYRSAPADLQALQALTRVLGKESWLQHQLVIEDYPRGFHFDNPKRAALLTKIAAALDNRSTPCP